MGIVPACTHLDTHAHWHNTYNLFVPRGPKWVFSVNLISIDDWQTWSLSSNLANKDMARVKWDQVTIWHRLHPKEVGRLRHFRQEGAGSNSRTQLANRGALVLQDFSLESFIKLRHRPASDDTVLPSALMSQLLRHLRSATALAWNATIWQRRR